MKFDITRAWKDEAYRQSLSEEELALLPNNPAGELELTDMDMESIFGGNGWGSSSCGPDSYNFGEGVYGYNDVHFVSATIALCNTQVYSVNVVVQVLSALSPVTTTCTSAY